jgi:MFS transporter, DHA2 family, multidrug resistance protein
VTARDSSGAPHHVGLVTFGTMLATIMQALDTTIANVALPHMQGTFSATQDQITWVLTSYIVAAAIMTPPTGWLAARFGRKRLYLVSVAGFTVASVLCALAMTIDEAVIFRLLQGAFGAALVPLSQATLLDSYPREKHGSAMAIWGLGIMVGPILGPMLGGWLTDNYSWRWVFYINVPVGALAFFVISTFVPETKRDSKLGFDVFGFLMLSLAIGAFQMFLDRGESKDWFGSYEIMFEAAIAGLAFYLFLVHTFTTDKPFISPAIFRDRSFSASLVLIFIVGVILYATMALMPPFLQNLLNYPVVTTGLLLAPRGVGTMIAMLVVGRAMRWIDPRLVLVAGLGLSAYSLYWMEGFSLYVSSREIILSGVVQGIGLGFTWVPLSTVAFATLPVERRTEAAGLFSLLRNVGSSAGISLVTVLLAQNTQINHASLVAGITPYTHLLDDPAVKRFWDPWTTAGALALNGEITRQASMIAYINDFKLMMIVTLLSFPFVLLLSSPRSAAKPKEAVVMD